jgi:hypothetical protein
MLVLMASTADLPVGAGGGRPPPANRWAWSNPRPYRDHGRRQAEFTDGPQTCAGIGPLHNTVVIRIRPIGPTRQTVATRRRQAKIVQATPRELVVSAGSKARDRDPRTSHLLSPEGSNDLRDKTSSNQGVSFCRQMNPISLIDVRS